MAEETPTQTLARLRRQLAELDRGMASGILTVESPDTGRMTYRTYAEMRAARSDLLARIRELAAAVEGEAPRLQARRVVVMGRSGF